MSTITVKQTIVDSEPGAELKQCVREAIILSLEKDIVVVLNHNDQLFQITPSEILSTVQQLS